MMFFQKRLSFDKNVNKDVVLCETTNRRASRFTLKALDNDRISYTKQWKHVPFYRRSAYQGANQVCVISINRNEYHRARRSIDSVDRIYRNRLMLNVI